MRRSGARPGYAKLGNAHNVWELYQQLREDGLKPNGFTYVYILGTCASVEALEQGKKVHVDVLESGLESDAFVGTALVTMYGNCGELQNARQAFDRMSRRGIVPCNAMLAAYAKHGEGHNALKLWRELKHAGLKPDAVTFVCILNACANLEALDEGKKIHASAIEAGYELDVFVGTALISMYAKCGSVIHARESFDKMCVRNLVTWNAMITGYSRHESAFEAIRLYQEMKSRNIKADEVTFVSLLHSCASLTALEEGKQVHCDVIAAGLETKVIVATALISMYAKCGSLTDARQVFNSMPKRDRVCWNAMITGYAVHGNSKEAFRLFWRMQEENLMPDELTFTSVLTVCSHLGLLDQGRRLFNHMIQVYHFTPKSEHFVCMIDLFGRAGHLDEAYNFIKAMPIPPDANIWRAFLSACRLHGNLDLAEVVIEQLIELEPGNPAAYVLLSNIYGAAGRWEEKAKVRNLMKDRGVKKEPGRSFIDTNKTVQELFANDQAPLA
ncbi:hypothetical protein O6H91_Y058800 [Diphasiastrum complanatum]|nr:hypothetical protein O6H91_Y058800 [Diphasiastrum complanatum]